MRILVHDFAGHPFQAQLSRELARRGHEVTHAYCGGVTTGRGDLARRPDDPRGLAFQDVESDAFERYAPLKRLQCEWRYGLKVARLVEDLRPDVIVSANTPLIAQSRLWRAATRAGSRRIYWLQDFLGRGVRAVLSERSSVLGWVCGLPFEHLETVLLKRSDAIVAIADDFEAELSARGVRRPCAVIENWAPLDEITVSPKENSWAQRHGLHQRPVALYAGTLGLKHDPTHLIRVAKDLVPFDAIVVVVTEGLGREMLERARREERLTNLLLLDFVPYEDLPHVLGAADVCMVLLEQAAGRFSVPSKTLTYIAARRPVVAAMPAENLGARVLHRAGAGVVVSPGDHAGFAQAVRSVLTDETKRTSMAENAAAYARSAFEIEGIADRFLATLHDGGQRKK